ncbi:MAG TPA: hypothetical protein VJC11_02150, partial [Patescibacteria group bacterium]|nr:hypothetical protein [Patescibacteria group bacterium]
MTVEKRFAKGYIFSDRPHPEARRNEIFLQHVTSDDLEMDARPVPTSLWNAWDTVRIGKPIT